MEKLNEILSDLVNIKSKFKEEKRLGDIEKIEEIIKSIEFDLEFR